jgi:hypothetical protein
MSNKFGSQLTASVLVLSALVVLVPTALFAQGNSGNSKGKSKGPSSSPLPVASAGAPGIGATPVAWVDDANLMPAGAVSIDIAASHWSGADSGETSVPVTNVAIGLTDRLQLAVSVPRIVGDPATGVVGGLGTTYVSVKYSAYVNGRTGLKVAVAPTLELLGTGVLPSLGPGETRAQLGLPVSVELDRAGRRFYASSGWFSRGVWFVGGGVGTQVTRRTGVSASFSHSWTAGDPAVTPARDRSEVSGGVAFAATPNVSLFAAVGHTIATLDENGAGGTVSAGVSLFVAPQRAVPPPRRRRD